MTTGHADTGDRLTRIERMIGDYHLARARREERRAITLLRKMEIRLAIVAFERPLERVH